jgi:hypothetical protein
MRGRKLLIGAVVLAGLAGAALLIVQHLLGSDLVRQEIERQLATYLQQPVSIKGASASIYPNVAVELVGVTVGEPAAIQIGELRIVTGLRPLLSRRVDGASVTVRHGRVSLPIPFSLTPPVGPAVSTSSPGLAVTSVGAIELRDVTLVSGGQEWIVDADCSLVGDRLEVSRITAEGPSTQLQGAGAFSSLAAVQGQFSVRADPLNFDELLAFGAGLSQPSASAAAGRTPATPMNLSVTLAAPAGRLASYPFRDLSATAAITPAALSLSPLSIGAFGGTFSGAIEARTSGELPQLRMSGNIAGLDVAEVLKAASSQGGITGRLGGTVSLAASGTQTEGLLRTARGSIVAAITDGSMPRMEIVRPIVLAFGKPNGAPPAGSGSAFRRLGGTFRLAGGAVSSDDLSMNARDFDLAGRGTLQLISGALTGRADVTLSPELSAQAGVDLRRYAQEDGRVVVPATFGGTLQQPSVSLDVAAATRRALGNELQRRAKSVLDGLLRRK